MGRGVLAPSWVNFRASGLLFKTSSSVGDEVPLPQRPALGPLVHSVGGSPWFLEPGLFKISWHMSISTNLSSGPREVVNQTPETTSPGCHAAAELKSDSGSPPRSSKCDALKVLNVPPSFSYRVIHSLFKPFGMVLRIRIIYDGDTAANRCYIVFSSSDEAQLAFESAASLPFTSPESKVVLLSSRNISESEDDYVPNVFEGAATDTVPEERHVPTPQWFVAYYRNGKGNYIHATRYLQKEVGAIQKDNMKKYGKGILVRAKDLTQAKMLQHMPCPPESIFESVKPHRTFNSCKGVVYNYDLFEFPEEEIYAMCPKVVEKVTKVKRSRNMIILTFYGSLLPHTVHIGPLTLKVKPFLDRPLQCYSCYGYGHGRSNCTERARCGHCSALDAHPTSECVSSPYCYHCRDDHPLRSRDCPKYHLEQDILHLANAHFISLGSARRELAFRQGKDGKAKSFATSLGSRTSKQLATDSGYSRSSRTTADSSRPSPAATQVSNRYALLSDDTNLEVATTSNIDSSAQPMVTDGEVHVPVTSERRSSCKGMHKRHHSSTDSVDSADVSPPKVTVSVRDQMVSPTLAKATVQEHSVVAPVISSAPVVAAQTAVGSTVVNNHGLQDFCEEMNIDKSPDSVSSVSATHQQKSPSPQVQPAPGRGRPLGRTGTGTFSESSIRAPIIAPGPSRKGQFSSVRPSQTIPIRKSSKVQSLTGMGKSSSGTSLHPRH